MKKRKIKLKFYTSFYILISITLGIIAMSLMQMQVQTLRSNADTPSTAPCVLTSANAVVDNDEQSVLENINQYREQHNLKSLKFEHTLTNMAAWHAADMAVNDTVNLVDSLGRPLFLRANQCGVTAAQIDEIVAGGKQDIYKSPQNVVTYWEKQSESNVRLLDSTMTAVGIARTTSSTGTYWSVTFSNQDVLGTEISPTTDSSNTQIVLSPDLQNNAAITTTPVPSKTAYTSQFTIFLDGIGQVGDRSNPTAGGNKAPFYTQRTISIRVFNSSDKQVASTAATVTYNATNGNFVGYALIPTLPSGVYSVKVKSERYLEKILPGIQSFSTGKMNLLPAVVLVTGDVNGDNILNIVDYSWIMDCYSDLYAPKNCNAYKKTMADLTDDTRVNQNDYNLFLREIGNQTGD